MHDVYTGISRASSGDVENQLGSVDRQASLPLQPLGAEEATVQRMVSAPVTDAEKLDAKSKPIVPRSFSFLGAWTSPSPRAHGKSIIRSIISGQLDFGSQELFSVSRQGSLIPTAYCSICLENVDASTIVSAADCEMHHAYCKPCMKGYITSMIMTGTVAHACPGSGCAGTYKGDEIKRLVSVNVYDKYARFLEVKLNPNYRECPQCNEGITFQPSDSCTNITCAGCELVYCFYHSNAHPDMTCEEYARTVNQVDEATNALISRTTKMCPQCSAPTEKRGGCNHM
jgi:hypothetical protein